MSEEIIPQEPGALGSVDQGKVDALAEGSVADVVEQLDTLTDDELEQLQAIESKNKARSTLLGAIARELQQREVAQNSPLNAPEEPPAPVGDATSYARMRASEVDPTKLTGRVLTLDGWVLPRPAASPVA